MNNNYAQWKIAIFDFDETLIKGQSQRLLIKYFLSEGYINIFQYFKILIWFILFKFNIVGDIGSIFEYAVKNLKDVKVSDLENVFNDFFLKVCVPRIYPNSKELVRIFKNNNYRTLLISTAIDPIIFRAQQYFEIDEIICTKLEIINNTYTGKIESEPMFSKNKLFALKEYVNKNNFEYENMYSFADHLSDLALLSSTGHPVAVNPSNDLWKSAQKSNWPVLYLENNESFQHFKSNTKF